MGTFYVKYLMNDIKEMKKMEGRYDRMAKYLDGLRWLAGLTQQDLCDKLGITRQTLLRIKKLKSMPPLYYHAIRDVLRINPINNIAMTLLVDSEEHSDQLRNAIFRKLIGAYKAIGPRSGMTSIMYGCRKEFIDIPVVKKIIKEEGL